MRPIIVYRSRPITKEDVAFIRRLIANHPEDGRCALSKKICHTWNWVQPNGYLKDMVCRGLLLRLEREGHIVLPPTERAPPGTPFCTANLLSLWWWTKVLLIHRSRNFFLSHFSRFVAALWKNFSTVSSPNIIIWAIGNRLENT